MKKLILLFCVAFAFVFVSCKSTAQETDNSAASLVDGQIEGQDESANSGENEDADAAAKAASALEAAEAARQAAIDAGAKDYYGAAFAMTDNALEALKALNDGKNHDKELDKLKTCFEALASASKAKKLKERIDQEGLAVNDQADYDKGKKALEEFDAMAAAVTSTEISQEDFTSENLTARVESAFKGISDPALFSKKATEAYDSFYAVYFKSYKKFAIEERKKALAQKKAADAVKAQVARKAEYKSDADLIIKGDQKYATSNPEAAYNNYKEAASNFEALAKDVAAKRAEAQKAIEEAKAKVAASSEYAAKADVEKPLGDEPVAGIEAEDTVLLEVDQFESPDKEIIVIEESVQEAK